MLFVVLYAENRKKRTEWCKKWLLKRNSLSHISLMKELSLYPTDFINYTRMPEAVFLELLKMVEPLIRKEDTRFRESISPFERLSATMRFLATGMTYEELKYPTTISAQSLGHIIPETCKAILKCLHKDYMKVRQIIVVPMYLSINSPVDWGNFYRF